MTRKTIRHDRLGAVLRRRRREVQDEVRSRIRDRRSDCPKEVGDELDCADASSQGEIDLALLQMSTEALSGIEAAIGRLDANQYGVCLDCTGEIAERRLRALSFAVVRCQACEVRREEARKEALAHQGGSLERLSNATAFD